MRSSYPAKLIPGTEKRHDYFSYCGLFTIRNFFLIRVQGLLPRRRRLRKKERFAGHSIVLGMTILVTVVRALIFGLFKCRGA